MHTRRFMITAAASLTCVVGLILGFTKTCSAQTPDWGQVHVSKDADGHVEASLHNSKLTVRYGWAPPNAEGYITNFVANGSPNMAGEMLDASAGRGTLSDAAILHDGPDCKTIDLKWKSSQKPYPVFEQTITIYPDQPVLRIDYLTWNVNIVDIGAPGGERRSATSDKVDYTIYGSDQWKRGFVSYPMIYMDRSFWDVGFDGIHQTDDPTPLDYHGYLIMGITSKANGMGFGRLMPTESTDIVKLLVHAGFELFPSFKRDHEPFACYLYAVNGGPGEVLSLGKKLADGNCPGIQPIAPAPTFTPPGGVFTGQTPVTLAGLIPGSEVRFTTDGSEPTAASPVFTHPILITATTQLRARTFRAGWAQSVPAATTYVISHHGSADWWSDAWAYRLPVEIAANGAARHDAVASVHFDFDAILNPLVNNTAKFAWPTLRVQEVDTTGKIIDDNVNYQWDSDGQYYSSNKGTLHILLKGATAPEAARRFFVYFDTTDKPLPGIEHPAMIDVNEDVPWKGQLSYQIITDRATYYLHESGGALAGMIDPDGNDWISYDPRPNSEGESRGIPNCDNAFHPGYPIPKNPQTLACNSDLTYFGPLHTRISCTTADNAYAGFWDFYPDHARFTITKSPMPYSFAYEGTPAGRLDTENDFFITSDGARHNVSGPLSQHLPQPRWVFFGKQGINRGLLLAHHEEPSADVTDEFLQTEDNTVAWKFGFRKQPPQAQLSDLPGHLTIAFLEPPDRSKLPGAVAAVFRDLDVKVASAEQRH